jgi:ribonuclease P protein component
MAADAGAAFPKTARVRRRAEFVEIKRCGARCHLPSFVVVRRESPTGHARLGITVSRRVGNAVVRNRLKRMIREVFRTSRRDVAAGQDVLVIARTDAHKLEYAQVASELERVFRSSGG